MASDDEYSTTKHDSLSIGIDQGLLANDSDVDNGAVLTVSSIDTDGTHGSVTVAPDGSFTYDPNGQFADLGVGETATDSFTYTVTDEYGETATATVTLTIHGDSLQVSQVTINDGSAQRSMVTELNVTFNTTASVAAGAFQVVNRDTHETVAIDVTTALVGEQTVATIRFADGNSVESRPIGNSLADGNYELIIDAAKVTANGLLLDGDGDGTGGDAYRFGNEVADDFFRLFGDDDGNGEVDLFDVYDAFVPSYGSAAGDPAYRDYFDWDGNGEIDLFDVYDHLVPSYGKVRDVGGF